MNWRGLHLLPSSSICVSDDEKNNLNEIGKNIYSEFFITQTLQHLMRGQGRLSILFAEKLPEETRKSVLTKIVENGIPETWVPCEFCPMYFYTRWSTYAVLAFFKINSKFIPSESFFMTLLSDSDFNWQRQLAVYLNRGDDEIIEEFEAQFFVELLVMLYSYAPGLYRSIQHTANKALDKINPSLLYSYCKLDVFLLKTDLSNKIIQSFPIELINTATINEFLGDLILLQNPLDGLRLQCLAIYNEPFPRKSSLFDEDETFTLVNQCLRKNLMYNTSHFINEIVNLSKREIESGNFQKAMKLEKEIPGFLPYSFLATYKDLEEEPLKFYALLEEFTKIDQSPFIISLYKAMKNDNCLFNDIYKITGTKVSHGKLCVTSVPKLLECVLETLPESQIPELLSNQLFSITDYDRSIDLSFLYAYQTLIQTFNYIINGDMLDLSYLISQIEDEHIQDALIIDLFSLIFLQNKRGIFICNIANAEFILATISGYLKDPSLFNSAMKKIAYAKVSGYSDLERCMVNHKEVVLALLKNPNSSIDAALQLATDNKNLYDAICLIKEMRELRDGKFVWQITVNNRDLLGTEYFLSMGDSILPLSDPREEVKIIIERRKQSINYMPLDITQAQLINNAVAYFQSGKLDGTLFTQYHLFSSFCSYIALLSRLSEKSVQATRQSVIDLLNSSENFDWQDVEILLGKNAMEIALQYARRIPFNSRFFTLLKENVPLVALAIQYERNCLTEEDRNTIIGNAIEEKELKKPVYETQTIEDVKQMIDFYEDNFLEIPEKDFIEMSEIATKEVDIEVLNILYEKNHEYFINKLDPLDFDICDIKELFVFSHVRVSKAEEHGFTSFTPIEPIIDSFAMSGDFLAIQALHEDLKVDVLTELKLICSKDNEIAKRVQNCTVPEFRRSIKVKEETEDTFYLSLKKKFESLQIKEATIYKDLRTVSLLMKELIDYDNQPPEEYMNYYMSRVVESVSLLTVFSGSLEARAHILMQKLCRVLYETKKMHCNDVCIDMIITLGNYVESFPFSRSKEKYDFSSFQTKEKGYFFARICSDLNNRELMLQFCSLWRLDYAPLLIKRANICFQISLFDEGVKELELAVAFAKESHNKITAISQKSKELIDKMCDILSNNCLFDVSDETILKERSWRGKRDDTYEAIMDLFQNECLMNMTKFKNSVPIMQYAFKLVENIDTLPLLRRCSSKEFSISVSSPQIQALLTLLKSLNESRRYMFMLSTMGDFEDAFKELDVVPKTKKLQMFRNTIIYPALAQSNWNTFWRRMVKDQVLFVSKFPLLEEFFNFLAKGRMCQTSYDIQMRLGLFEDAFKSALDGFKIAKKWKTRLKISQSMKDALSKLAYSTPNEIAAKRNKMTRESMLLFQGRLDTQMKIIRLCIKNNVPYNNELEIIINKQNALLTSAWLLKQYQFDIVFDMMQNGITPQSIFQNFIITLRNESPTAITKYCLSMPTKDELTYETVIVSIMSEISTMTTDRATFKAFVDSCVKIEQVKGVIFAQNGFYQEALPILKKKKKENASLIKAILEKEEANH